MVANSWRILDRIMAPQLTQLNGFPFSPEFIRREKLGHVRLENGGA